MKTTGRGRVIMRRHDAAFVGDIVIAEGRVEVTLAESRESLTVGTLVNLPARACIVIWIGDTSLTTSHATYDLIEKGGSIG
jgi:hypothetical protein